MSYSNVPLLGQTLGNTRDSINTNFDLIQTAESANHIAIGGAGAGKHKFCQFPEQGSDPITDTNEGALYTKVGASPSATESNLFFRSEDSAGTGGQVYQLTRVDETDFSKFGAEDNYGTPGSFTQRGAWTFLPGGLLLQYGTFGKSLALGTSGTIQLPKNFSSGTSYMVTFSNQSGTNFGSINLGSKAAGSFNFHASVSNLSFINWIAVGT